MENDREVAERVERYPGCLSGDFGTLKNGWGDAFPRKLLQFCKFCPIQGERNLPE